MQRYGPGRGQLHRLDIPTPGWTGFCPGPLSTTDGTELGGREEAVYHNHLPAVPRSLVLQLPPELAPACVGNGLGQLMVLDHVGRSQILDADHVVLPDEFSGQLVQHILPLVGNVLMEPCHLASCLFPAVAAL